jgi:uncharacterized membrane protein
VTGITTDRTAGRRQVGDLVLRRHRIESVDVVRGIVMVLMALDHTRDFFGIPGQNPVNLAATTPALFFTRWITHLCAPGFFLLTGVGARLALRHRSRAALSRFLCIRGLWLIALDLVVARCLVYQFNVDYRVTMLLVLWALGWAMIALGLMAALPGAVVTTIGLTLIAGHNAFDDVQWSGPIWSILHVPGIIWSSGGRVVFVSYPLIPWIGVTAAGFGLGGMFEWEAERRRRWLLALGVGAVAAFVALRALGVYGEPVQWREQPTVIFTVMSFLNTTKYPPSLLYLLMTLGPVLLLLRAYDAVPPSWLRPTSVFGKAPLAYYLAHFAFIHLLAVAVCYARYGTAHWMFESPDLAHYPVTPPPGWGYGLPVVYAIWALVAVCMYPLCRQVAALKERHPGGLLSYM